jgi:hypothetical protein
VLTKYGIHTLGDIVIVDPMRVDLFFRSCASQGFATFYGVQAQQKSYRNQHLIDQFLPLAIEVFGCLHKHVDVF